MGDLISAGVGAIGSLFGASEQADAAEEAAAAQRDAARIAAEASLTGFNYLTEGPGAPAMQQYTQLGEQAIPAQQTAQNVQAQLLGLPAPFTETVGGGGERAAPAPSGSSRGGDNALNSVAGLEHLPESLQRKAAETVERGQSPSAMPAWMTRGTEAESLSTGGSGIEHATRRQAAMAGGYEGFMPTMPDDAQSGAQPSGSSEPAETRPVGGIGAEGARDAFDVYRDSTGYQFRVGEGMNAINANAAARGLLNSGATAKGLTDYGQNIASQEFGNYLNQLSGLNTQHAGLTQAGQNALGQIGSVGSTAGGGAASAIMSGAQGAAQAQMGGANARAAGIAGAASNFGNAIGGAVDRYRDTGSIF